MKRKRIAGGPSETVRALAWCGAAAAFFAAMVLLCCDVADGAPHWLARVLASKAAGMALLCLAAWAGRRIRKTEGRS